MLGAKTCSNASSRPAPASAQLYGRCLVCDDRSTGVHYGVRACEGCKGFFKRTDTTKITYRCYFGGACQITTKTRNNCKACRYQKCLRLGMAMDAVKMGRIPKAEKQRALLNFESVRTNGFILSKSDRLLESDAEQAAPLSGKKTPDVTTAASAASNATLPRKRPKFWESNNSDSNSNQSSSLERKPVSTDVESALPLKIMRRETPVPALAAEAIESPHNFAILPDITHANVESFDGQNWPQISPRDTTRLNVQPIINGDFSPLKAHHQSDPYMSLANNVLPLHDSNDSNSNGRADRLPPANYQYGLAFGPASANHEKRPVTNAVVHQWPQRGHTNGHTHTGANGHTHTGANGHAQTGANGHAHTGANGHAHTGANGHTHTGANGHAHTGANGHAHTGANGHAHTGANGHAHTGANGHAHTGANGHAHTGANGHAHTGVDHTVADDIHTPPLSSMYPNSGFIDSTTSVSLTPDTDSEKEYNIFSLSKYPKLEDTLASVSPSKKYDHCSVDHHRNNHDLTNFATLIKPFDVSAIHQLPRLIHVPATPPPEDCRTTSCDEPTTILPMCHDGLILGPVLGADTSDLSSEHGTFGYGSDNFCRYETASDNSTNFNMLKTDASDERDLYGMMNRPSRVYTPDVLHMMSEIIRLDPMVFEKSSNLLRQRLGCYMSYDGAREAANTRCTALRQQLRAHHDICRCASTSTDDSSGDSEPYSPSRESDKSSAVSSTAVDSLSDTESTFYLEFPLLLRHSLTELFCQVNCDKLEGRRMLDEEISQGRHLQTCVPVRALDIEYQKYIWRLIVEKTYKLSGRISFFWRLTPGFSSLPTCDQKALMSSSFYGLWLISNTLVFFDDEFHNRLGKAYEVKYSRALMSMFLPSSVIDEIFKMNKRLSMLALSFEEMALISVVYLTMPIHSGIVDHVGLSRLHQYYTNMLRKSLRHRDVIQRRKIYKWLESLHDSAVFIASSVNTMELDLPHRQL